MAEKSLNKLSYYDTLSNLVPGIVFLWALPVVGPFPKAVTSLILTGNTVVDSIILLALSYVVGHVLQFLSKYSIEPAIKRIFWEGNFFSEIYLIKAFDKCSKVEHQRHTAFAHEKLNFTQEDISLLDDSEVKSDEDKLKKALKLSNAIYRTIDAKTMDAGIAQKAHLQNTFYSFFRNLALLTLILALSDFAALIFGFSQQAPKMAFFGLLCLGLMIVFIVRAKERGEAYIKGLFWSYT